MVILSGMEDLLKSVASRVVLCRLLALAATFGVFGPIDLDLHDKLFVMIWTSLAEQVVERSSFVSGLSDFLEEGLAIFVTTLFDHALALREEMGSEYVGYGLVT